MLGEEESSPKLVGSQHCVGGLDTGHSLGELLPYGTSPVELKGRDGGFGHAQGKFLFIELLRSYLQTRGIGLPQVYERFEFGDVPASLKPRPKRIPRFRRGRFGRHRMPPQLRYPGV